MRSRLPIHRCLLILASCIVFFGCAGMPQETKLFDRLGGLPAITAVVDKIIDRSAADPRTRRSFDGVKLKSVKESVIALLCQASGGSCRYEGPSMARVHQGLGITSAEFDAFVGHLAATLDEFKVGAREKNELLELLASMKSDVVTK